MPALLKIDTALKNLSSENVGPLIVGSTIVDQVLVDQYGSIGWTVTVRRDDGARARYDVSAVHDGTLFVDAADGSYEVSGGAATSAAVGEATLSVALSGAGPTQVLQLVVTVTAGTWYCDVSRSPHVGTPG